MATRIVELSSLPQEITEIDNLWIAMPDGCRLAACAWMPANADREPVPAVLEYIPYRKRDGTAARDAEIHPFVAAHGYACLRVDMRGNGDSEGLMHDEYLEQEQQDAVAVIAWIAAQPWCDGRVGMMGKSWGGFNSLQVAALRPPALHAIITVCSTDDRYADDIHYRGGALLLENFGWSATMLAYSSRPPDPLLSGERWRELWLQRLQSLPLLAETWLQHPLRDDYWRHGSVCEDFSAIEVPVLAVGGWLDGYTNAVPRLLQGLQAPARGIIGPWVHQYPHHAAPEPAIGFLQECVGWWDAWLKDARSVASAQPLLRVFRQSTGRTDWNPDQAGDWLSLDAWPPPDTVIERVYPDTGGLQHQAPQPSETAFSSPQHTGAACGEFFPMALGPDLPGDQRNDDSLSLCFDSEPLTDALNIVGAPELHIELRCDQPRANLIARLCDLAPDGSSARISYAVLNLCHAQDHASATDLQPGTTYRFVLKLDDIAHRFAPGHRVRLALSNAYWPMVWPQAVVSTLTVLIGERTFLDLPVWSGEEREWEWAPAVIPPPLAKTQLRAPRQERNAHIDENSGIASLDILNDAGEYRIETHGLVSSEISRECYRIHPDDPCSAHASSHWTEELSRDDWSVRVETWCTQQADETDFILSAGIEAFEGETLVFQKTWERRVARRFN